MKTPEQKAKAFEALEKALAVQLEAAWPFEAAARKLLETSTAVGKAAAAAGIDPPKREQLVNRMSRCMAQAGVFEPSNFLDDLKGDHATTLQRAARATAA